MSLATTSWYEQHDCTHAHCPDGCEHPQPILIDGRMLCGRCLIRFGEEVEVIPCTPEHCEARNLCHSSPSTIPTISST